MTALDDDPRLAPAGGLVDHLNADAEHSEHALPGMLTRVVLEGREPFTVRVTNRDYLAWDKTSQRQKPVWKADETPFLFATFLAWSAARRAGEFDGYFDAFAEVCEEIDQRDVVTDPTKTVPEAG